MIKYNANSTDEGMIGSWIHDIGEARFRANVRKYLRREYRDLVKEGIEYVGKGYGREYAEYVRELAYDRMTANNNDIYQSAAADSSGHLTLEGVRFWVREGYEEELAYVLDWAKEQAYEYFCGL